MQEKNEVAIYKEEDVLEDQVDKAAIELSKEISKVDNKDDLDFLYTKFKINDTKKNIFRINKYNDLLDKVLDEASKRFTNASGEMSNKEVIDYMNAIQNQITNSKNVVESIKDINALQVNKVNNTVNVNINNATSTLSRESKEKVIDVIKEILDSTLNEEPIDEIVDMTNDNGDIKDEQ